MVCQFQNRDLNLGHFTFVSALLTPNSMVSLASLHSVFFTVFSTKSFYYILYLGTLKQTEVNPTKSSHLVKDWVEAMPLIQYNPLLHSMGQILSSGAPGIGFAQEGVALPEIYTNIWYWSDSPWLDPAF